MGQYVCVGIQNKVRVPKSGLDKFKDEYSHEELLDYFEMMESYGSFLGFVRRSLCEVFKKYKLIGAIRVWIDR